MDSIVPFLRLFATPLGDFINKSIATMAGMSAAWLVAKGMDATSAGVIIGGLVTAASAAISAAANSQGIQIKRINADPNNGVKVVSASNPAPAVSGPLA